MIAAIIPARGGSKGIFRKNLVEVAGKPLIAWSIIAAQKAAVVDAVYVTTDDDEIARISHDYGAQIIQRPAALASDEATSEAALVHALHYLRTSPSLVVFLQPTSPVRVWHDIDDAVQCLWDHEADSCFSACEVEGYTWIQNGGAPLPEYMTRRRRQDQDIRRLEENGSIYVFKPQVLLCYGKRLGGKVCVYEQDPLCRYQIDEPQDVALVESVMEIM
jgi:N-acylneuraminate cytidylyltransferase